MPTLVTKDMKRGHMLSFFTVVLLMSSLAYGEGKPIVMIEPAGDTKQLHLTAEILLILEHDAKTKFQTELNSYIQRGGYKDPPVQFTSGSRYMFAGPYKLAIVDVTAKDEKGKEKVKYFVIRGIKGSEGIGIMCFSSNGEDVSPMYGQCANSVKENFGYAIGQ